MSCKWYCCDELCR